MPQEGGVMMAYVLAVVFFVASVPHQINYQGWLGRATDTTGVTGTFDMTFTLYDAETGGTVLWTETHTNVKVTRGVFNVILGSVNPLPADIFTSGSLWLEIKIGDETLLPRKKLVSVGYAIRAIIADTANYVTGANVMGEVLQANRADTATYADTAKYAVVTNINYVDSAGVAHNAIYADTANYAKTDKDWILIGNILYPSSNYGLAMRQSNVLYGDSGYTHINFGVGCTTGAAGQNHIYCVISGGRNNVASNDYATVSGGGDNTASGWHATVSGGKYNIASDSCAVVGGGYHNTASTPYATVSGGDSCSASGWWSTVGGGLGDTASGDAAVVGGGYSNTASRWAATVSGGCDNIASASYATVGGGESNIASDRHATVSGGESNTASGSCATVSGGYYNTASGVKSTVGGGQLNTASAYYATVGGGDRNTASNFCSTVSGGYYNAALGYCATVPGGYSDTVSGAYSFATGYKVRVKGDTSFGFGSNFSTSVSNAVIFYAPSGMKVGINTTSPESTLHIVGGLLVQGNLVVTGAKNAVVTIDGKKRLIYCQESPEVWVEDFGSGKLVNGRAHIELDPTFLKAVTIDEKHPMRVFIQLNGDCNGVYVVKGKTGFDVIELRGGRSNVEFDYRVVAKRKGFENKRFEFAK